MKELIETSADSVITHGPWQALSVGMVVCVIVFLAILLRNLFLKNGSKHCSNQEIKEDIDILRQEIRKLFDNQHKMNENISEIRIDVAVIKSKSEEERSGK